jgi:predicted nucleotidyltransferase
MLERLLGSSTRAAILRMLFGPTSRELHIRELQRETGMALRSVIVQVNLLERIGLLRERRAGRQRYVRAETNHPAYEPLVQLVSVTAGIGDAIANALSGEPGVKMALLFGSVALQEETASSDIDLLVVGTLRLRDLMAILSPVRDRLGREINPVLMSAEEFVDRRRRSEHFLARVLASNPRVLIGDPHEFA